MLRILAISVISVILLQVVICVEKPDEKLSHKKNVSKEQLKEKQVVELLSYPYEMYNRKRLKNAFVEHRYHDKGITFTCGSKVKIHVIKIRVNNGPQKIGGLGADTYKYKYLIYRVTKPSHSVFLGVNKTVGEAWLYVSVDDKNYKDKFYSIEAISSK